MMYLLITNRPGHAEFALCQWKKSGLPLVVISNSRSRITEYDNHTRHHYHYPECPTSTELFNKFWEENYMDIWQDIFIADDDNFYCPELFPIGVKYLAMGWDRVEASTIGIHDLRRSDNKVVWAKAVGNAGNGVFISRHLAKLARWRGYPGGMYRWYKSLPVHNLKHIVEPLTIYNLHGDNIVIKEWNFDKNLYSNITVPKAFWDEVKLLNKGHGRG